MSSASSFTNCIHSVRALLLVGLSLLLPACSGCDVEIERSPEPAAKALFRWLLVGGTKDDGAFLVAIQENGPGGEEAVIVSLEEGSRTCSFGPAFWANTVQQSVLDTLDEHGIDERPARILTLDGDRESWTGTFHVFDASCAEVLSVPDVEGYTHWWFGDSRKEGVLVPTADGRLSFVDPWAGAITTLGEHVTAHGQMTPTLLWLVDDGALALRDRDGNTLVKVGSDVTEVAPSSDRSEVAYVDGGALFVMKLADLSPEPIATAGAVCTLDYTWLSTPGYTFLDDCATGELAFLDRATGAKQVFPTSAVTDAFEVSREGDAWLFFHREPADGERELWAAPPGGDPVLVGLSPIPGLYTVSDAKERGFFVNLDSDGETGTLGTWSPETGFQPLLERTGRAGTANGYLAAVAEREGPIGALVGLHLDTLDPAFRAEGVPVSSVWYSSQVAALGYIRDWDEDLGAGTFEIWVQATGQIAAVDEGVNDYAEIFWPEPGAAYSVRTPGREGLWTAHIGW